MCTYLDISFALKQQDVCCSQMHISPQKYSKLCEPHCKLKALKEMSKHDVS